MGFVWFVWWVGIILGGKEVMVEWEVYVIEMVIVLNIKFEMLIGKRIYVIVRVFNRVGKLEFYWK